MSARDLHSRSLVAIQTDPDPAAWPADVAGHVEGCEGCQRTLEQSRELRRSLRRVAGGDPPAGMLGRVRARLGEEAAPNDVPEVVEARRPLRRPTFAHRMWVPAALAAGLAIGVGIGVQLPDSTAPVVRVQDGEVVRTVEDYLQDVTHDRYLLERTGQPIEHVSSQATELSRWLSDGLGFELSLGPAPQDWSLEGGRVWHTLSRISALAVYRRGSEEITVFAVPAKGVHPEGLEPIRAEGPRTWFKEAWGFRGVAWYEGDLLWSVVGDPDRAELLAWARHFRSDA